ncbi:hypothetical protein AB434_1705 [Heyndrickxia coagulans]|nr:hypothetical protein AB434_1705 [Heyndrickxia coagulans]
MPGLGPSFSHLQQSIFTLTSGETKSEIKKAVWKTLSIFYTAVLVILR